MAKTLFLILVALAFQSIEAEAQSIERNLPFATLGPRNLNLDLYLPAQNTTPRPVVVWLHDGGWLTGSRDPVPSFVLALLDQGIAVASIDYRLTSQSGLYGANKVTFPAQIHDAKAAIRWLRANAASRNLDPDVVVAWGSSAGGHLAAMLGTSADRPELEGVVGGNLEYSSRVLAVVDYYGPTDLLNASSDVRTPPGQAFDHDAPGSPESLLIGFSNTGQGIGVLRNNLSNPSQPFPLYAELARQANPIDSASSGDAPTLAVHGNRDPQVPILQSQRLVDALNAVGVSASLLTVNGGGHGGFSDATHSAARNFIVDQIASHAGTIAQPRGLSGTWHDPNLPGQGFTLQVVPDPSNARLLTFFYGFRNTGANLWLIANATFSARYRVSNTISMLVADNGQFTGFNPASVALQPWGELRLTFFDCNHGRAELSGVDGTQVLNLEKITGVDRVVCD